MIACIIGSWDAIWEFPLMDGETRSDIDQDSIGDIDENLSNVDVVLYRRHCDICADGFLFYFLVNW